MTREKLDTLWFQAMRQSIKDGEDFIRYHFADLVAAEKDKEIVALRADAERYRWLREEFAALVAAEKDKEIAALKEERRRDMAEIYSLRESEESLREEVERLREELRQSSIDHTRAEVERLREALTVAAKAELYDPATGIIHADVLEIVQDTARAALQGETAIWSARHDPRG